MCMFFWRTRSPFLQSTWNNIVVCTSIEFSIWKNLRHSLLRQLVTICITYFIPLELCQQTLIFYLQQSRSALHWSRKLQLSIEAKDTFPIVQKAQVTLSYHWLSSRALQFWNKSLERTWTIGCLDYIEKLVVFKDEWYFSGVQSSDYML